MNLDYKSVERSDFNAIIYNIQYTIYNIKFTIPWIKGLQAIMETCFTSLNEPIVMNNPDGGDESIVFQRPPVIIREYNPRIEPDGLGHRQHNSPGGQRSIHHGADGLP